MKVYFIRSIFQDIVSMDTVIMKIMVSTWLTFFVFWRQLLTHSSALKKQKLTEASGDSWVTAVSDSRITYNSDS